MIENRDRDRNRKRDRGILPCPSSLIGFKGLMEEQLLWFAVVLILDFSPLPKTLVPICISLVLFLVPVLSLSAITPGNLSIMSAHLLCIYLTLNHRSRCRYHQSRHHYHLSRCIKMQQCEQLPFSMKLLSQI